MIREVPPKFDLEENEFLCDECNGLGLLPINDPNIFNRKICEKCKGSGVLNWVERVFGKQGIYIWGSKRLKKSDIRYK